MICRKLVEALRSSPGPLRKDLHPNWRILKGKGQGWDLAHWRGSIQRTRQRLYALGPLWRNADEAGGRSQHLSGPMEIWLVSSYSNSANPPLLQISLCSIFRSLVKRFLRYIFTSCLGGLFYKVSLSKKRKVQRSVPNPHFFGLPHCRI